jgi:hypothetical protein
MRVFRFWHDLELKFSFRCTYALVNPREVTDRVPHFDQIVAAIKEQDCRWAMYEVTEILVEKSPGLSDFMLEEKIDKFTRLAPHP